MLTNFAVGDQMRNFRIAVAATTEYTVNFAGGDKDVALAEINDLVTGLNAVYEKEASVHFNLVSGKNLIFNEPASNDGYSNSSTPNATNLNTLLGENQTIIDSVIGTNGYDIGIVVGYEDDGNPNSFSARGLGALGSVTSPTRKAQAATIGSPDWSGYLDVMIHELGHQFNMSHTFSGASGNCTSGNWSQSSSVEPGSGSTIMSYSGNCGGDNIPADGDEVFHSFSFEQMEAFIAATATPYSTTAKSNAIPTLTLPTPSQGTHYTVPANTPFELTATGADANAGDNLRYSWEQIDPGNSRRSLPVSDPGNGPLFRVFSPQTSSNRVFPRLSDLLANNDTATIGEALPSTTRDMNFRLTVRDGNGGINSADVLVKSHDTGSAFAVSSPNTNVTWIGGSSQDITWNVAGTTAAPVSTANVNILFSSDGGNAYTTLESGVPNDGSHQVTIPNIDTTTARIKVEAADNIFFDVSNSNFSITSNSGGPGVNLIPTDGSTRVGEGSIIDSYDFSLNTDPSGTAQVTISGGAQALVSLNGSSFSATQSFSVSSTAARTIYVQAIDDAAEEGPHTSNISHSITTSTSSAYPNTFLIQDLVVDIVDDELPPVIGVDVDFDSGNYFGPSPNNWNRITAIWDDASNVAEDDGTPTTIDLVTTPDPGFWNSSFSGTFINSANLPRHGQSLVNLNAYANLNQNLTATWTSLEPGTAYGVFVFGLGSQNDVQAVSIVGANTIPTFTQTLTNGVLVVNGETGSNTRTLKSYEHVVTANASGQINIAISATGSSGQISLAGLAIRKILTAPSDTTPPTITNVRIGASIAGGTENWSSTFLASVDPGDQIGYPIPKDANQLKPLPWNNMRQIFVDFSEDIVSLNTGDIVLRGVNTTNYTPTVTYDSTNFRATIELPAAMEIDKYLLVVKESVTDAASNMLDGDWSTGSGALTSGNLTAGGDFEFRFDVLPGDFTQSGQVAVNDLGGLRIALGQNTAGGNYDALADFDGSGSIAVVDVGTLRANLGLKLPTGTPTATTLLAAVSANDIDAIMASDHLNRDQLPRDERRVDSPHDDDLVPHDPWEFPLQIKQRSVFVA